MTEKNANLILKKGEERRLKRGHNWVFSNEVDTGKSPLSNFEPGQSVRIIDSVGSCLGLGHVNPTALICARRLTRRHHLALDKSWLVHRIQVALSMRQHLFQRPYYRLIYGDSDGLSGLVVDRYADVLVVQITSAGMELAKDQIITALVQVLKPSTIILRNDSAARKLEGLDCYTETVFGSTPKQLELEENNTRFIVPVVAGQKTGWFYDHRLNRKRAAAYARDKRVLDVFSYVGSWGIQAAVGGAKHVHCIDNSAQALEILQENAQLNRVAEHVTYARADVFAALKALRDENERYDVIIVDPPAFIPRKKDVKAGTEAYRRVNQLAMQLLSKDGMLITSSCSSYLFADRLKQLLLKTSRHLDRFLQLTEQGHQGPDHPIHPAMPETEYLKSFFCRILPTP